MKGKQLKHIVSLTIKDLKDLGILGRDKSKKKKRKRRRIKRLLEDLPIKENIRSSNDFLNPPPASASFSNSNNIAIDTQHRVNEAIRQKEEAEREKRANEPTLKQLEEDVRFGIGVVNEKVNQLKPSVSDDFLVEGIPATSPVLSTPAPSQGIRTAQQTLSNFNVADIYKPQSSEFNGSPSRGIFAAEENEDDADFEPYNQDAAEMRPSSTQLQNAKPAVGIRKQEIQRLKDIITEKYGSVPDNIINSTRKKTFTDYIAEQDKRANETKLNAWLKKGK